MKVLVIGGSGFVGRNLSRELAARGHVVTVLSRTPDIDGATDIRSVSGDVTRYDSIEDAFEGQDVVVNLVALSPLFTPEGGNEMHDRVHRGGTENVVAGAEAHDVERIVQMSALGADPDGQTAYIRAKGSAETAVRESSLDRVIVRPSVVFGDGGEFVSFTRTLTTPYVSGLPGGGKTRFQPLWVGDLVPMLADCVERDEHVGATYELGGPEVLTLAEVATQIYRADGKSVRILPIPMLVARIGLAIGGMIPGFPMDTDQYRSLTFDNTVQKNSVSEFDVDLRDFRTLAEYLDGGETPPRRSSSRPAGGVS